MYISLSCTRFVFRDTRYRLHFHFHVHIKLITRNGRLPANFIARYLRQISRTHCLFVCRRSPRVYVILKDSKFCKFSVFDFSDFLIPNFSKFWTRKVFNSQIVKFFTVPTFRKFSDFRIFKTLTCQILRHSISNSSEFLLFKLSNPRIVETYAFCNILIPKCVNFPTFQFSNCQISTDL